MSGRRRVPLPLLVWLALVWVGLWGNLSWANALGGLTVALLVLVLLPPVDTGARGAFRPLRVLGFLAYFAWALVRATAVVAMQVLFLRRALRQAVVAVPVRTDSAALLTIIANAISLTPGTLTLEVDRAASMLYVHALDVTDPDDVRRDVYRLEQIVVRAFGSAASLAAVETADPRERP